MNNAPAVSILVQWEGTVPEDATWEDFNDIQRRFPWFSGEGAVAQEGGYCYKMKPSL